jgi:hypothetical protein
MRSSISCLVGGVCAKKRTLSRQKGPKGDAEWKGHELRAGDTHRDADIIGAHQRARWLEATSGGALMK